MYQCILAYVVLSSSPKCSILWRHHTIARHSSSVAEYRVSASVRVREMYKIGCSLLSSGEIWYRDPAMPFQQASVYSMNGLLKSGWISTGALERAD